MNQEVHDERVPAVIRPLLDEALPGLDRNLPGLVAGFYLAGSVALGGFNPRFSDIDFVALLSRPVEANDWQALARIHRTIERKYPAWKLEGIYLQPVDVGCRAGEPLPFPAFHDGRLKPSRSAGLNPVTWWILKQRGIALRGARAADLPFEVDWAGLLAWMHGNLNSYWKPWTVRPVRLLTLLSDYGLQWAVLGVLRPFYTLREGEIVTKTQAGEYALTCLEERWHPVIREALAIREGRGLMNRAPRLQQALDARGLLREVIRLCNEIQAGQR
jgi:hypothetical protein